MDEQVARRHERVRQAKYLVFADAIEAAHRRVAYDGDALGHAAARVLERLRLVGIEPGHRPSIEGDDFRVLRAHERVDGEEDELR